MTLPIAGHKAAAAAASIGAAAFNVGRDIVFGEGQYAPSTPRGKLLLAHESAHVAQRGSGSSSVPSLEAEANRSAALMVAGGPALVSGSVAARPVARKSRGAPARAATTRAAALTASPDAARRGAATASATIAARPTRGLSTKNVWPTTAVQRGGSGKHFDWKLAREARRRYPVRKFVLAGGLDPDNVGAAIAQIAPWGVDVATGIEAAPGSRTRARSRRSLQRYALRTRARSSARIASA